MTGGHAPARGPVTAGRHYLRADGRSILPVGAHVVPPEGPDWPWRVGPEAFDRAFAGMAALGLDTARIDLLWEAVEPAAGALDEAHLRVLDAVLAAGRRHGIRLHPTLFVGGEVGDAYWDLPWRGGRHPHRDPEMLGLQARHAAALAERWAGDPAILAWDLTDEPPFWPFRDTTDEDARRWTRSVAAALRSADPAHLLTIGTASQEVGHGPFRADVVGLDLDFATVHPYPIYAPELYPDALLSPRMTHAAAFETALAAGAGRPVMVHEYGASSAQFDQDRIAAYDRLLAWSALGRGAIGFLAWCWTDAEPAAFRRVPYRRAPHETQFGVTDWRGDPRPRGRVLAELASLARSLDLDALASRGPVASAAIPVPHEFVRPYDAGAFGLEAPSGLYRPAEQAWSPSRDVLPLVRGWLNAFVLAARAGLSVSFPREAPDGARPDARLILLPAPLASTSSSLLHVATSWLSGAPAFLARGGTLYVSCSADVAIPEMAALAGCRIADRAPMDRPAVLRFVRAWGPFAPGDELVLPAWDGSLATRGVTLALAGGDTIALAADGSPALVVAATATGRVVTCAYPVELLLAGVPDAHGPGDRSWGLYAGLAALAGGPEAAFADHADVTSGALEGDAGGLLVLTNHAAGALEIEAALPDAAVTACRVDGAIPLPLEDGRTALRLDAHGSAVVEWRREAADAGRRSGRAR